uniref:AP2/ERF domain-containing protein n=1 Tax=viral metagenome TaxID=1070528 RepID=A0A6M3K8N4_9ZZZZ
MAFSQDAPPRGIVWHHRQKAWRVVVKKMDRSVNPPKQRKFYREFKDFDAAIRVRDYVSRMLHGSNAKLHTDGRLPSTVSRLDVIRWLVAQSAIESSEVAKFTARVNSLDTPPTTS